MLQSLAYAAMVRNGYSSWNCHLARQPEAVLHQRTVGADPDDDDGGRAIAGLIALFGNQPNRAAREPLNSPPRRQDNSPGKPEDPDRTVQAKRPTGSLPARRLPVCLHRSRKVGSCDRISGPWLRVRCHQSKGSSADVLSTYQSPNLRSAIAGLRV